MAGKHASVHPCRHGAVMKKIIDVLMSRGVNPEVDKYVSNLPLPPPPYPLPLSQQIFGSGASRSWL
jgi:hypothetical protein